MTREFGELPERFHDGFPSHCQWCKEPLKYVGEGSAEYKCGCQLIKVENIRVRTSIGGHALSGAGFMAVVKCPAQRRAVAQGWLSKVSLEE